MEPWSAIIYTLLMLVPVGISSVMASGLYWFFHDPFSSVGSLDYLGPENWRFIRNGAMRLFLLFSAGIWILYLVDTNIGTVIGFFLLITYFLLFYAIISDEVEDARREREGGWRYGWY
ncbi:hypothetical protein [Thermococcus thermotolerans]|uniref:hypothetical protein n=1 Tax=Thermococcus thermotolerans TaxID=2969672 RepID=UPI002157BAEF|nr:hypothetical protein [Thermococcus thermotolerans]